MKIRNNFIIITALCLATFALGSCDYWEPADQSSINISFDDSNARATSSLVSDMIYTITLTSPGKGAITKTTEIGETSISIPVSEGQWSIHVQGEGARRIGEGTGYVLVTAGKPASALIKMNVTSTKAHSYEEIVADFNDNSLPNQFVIEIFGSELIAHSSANNTSPNIAILGNGKTITLRAKAESGLTIKRDNNVSFDINSNIFKITDGTLILDGETGGTITIDGMRGQLPSGKTCLRALINVEEKSSSQLIMLNRVTLKNNTTQYGGGVYVSKGTFIMKGGTISGNFTVPTSQDNCGGGGVFIRDGGYFYKYGGTVYGNDVADQLKNIDDVEKGHAVYCEKTPVSNSIAENLTLYDNTAGNKNFH